MAAMQGFLRSLSLDSVIIFLILLLLLLFPHLCSLFFGSPSEPCIIYHLYHKQVIFKVLSQVFFRMSRYFLY